MNLMRRNLIGSSIKWQFCVLVVKPKFLRAKREVETLTEAEHQTLIQLSSAIEAIGADRLEALATLAQIRQVSLTELMKMLGIQPVTYV
jgi:hypothetical protein